MRHEGRGSEGFLEHIFKHAAKELFGLDVHEITYKNLRWETAAITPYLLRGNFTKTVQRSSGHQVWFVGLKKSPPCWFCRNRDFQEVTLERDGETLLQFAAVYGFRNIQTLVHRMRTGRVPYQLVEVLSCPGGSTQLST